MNTETEVNAMRYKLPLKFSFCPIVFCIFVCKLEYLLQIFLVIKGVIIIFVIDMFLLLFFLG